VQSGGLFSDPPRQTNKSNWGVEEMNWGLNPPIPPAIPTLVGSYCSSTAYFFEPLVPVYATLFT